MFGDGSDEDLEDLRNYRDPNRACSQVDLSSSTMSVRSFRALVACLNSNKAIQPIEDLADKLSDEELAPLVDLGNRYLLNNRSLIYQIESTYFSLRDNKILDEAMVQLGRLLENEEFVSSLIALMQDSYYVERNFLDAMLFRSRAPDYKLLKSLEILSRKITVQNTADALDVGLTLAGANAFQSLQRKFRGSSPSQYDLDMDIIRPALHFLAASQGPYHVNVGKEAIREMVNGKLFRSLDEVVGRTPERIEKGVPAMSSIMKATLVTEWDGDGLGNPVRVPGRIMDNMTSLFYHVKNHGKIYCLKGSMFIENGIQHMIRELTLTPTMEAPEFIKRSNPLTLTVMNPFCTYPAKIEDYYPAMIRLADSSAIYPATDLLKAFQRFDLVDFLVNILSDTGNGEDGFPVDSTGIKLLLPTLAELTDRGTWDDLFFLLSMPTDSGRETLKDTLSFLIESQPELGGESLYDVLSRMLARTSPENLYRLLMSMKPFVESDEPLVMPALTGLRKAFYINDVHPLVDVGRRVLSEATQNQGLYATLFEAAQYAEFKASVKLVSEMSKDGRLKDLLGSMLSLFHRYAQPGKVEIRPGVEPAHFPDRRHNLSFDSLNAEGAEIPKLLPVPPWDPNEPCRNLRLTMPMDVYTAPGYDNQIYYLLGCINSDQQHGEVVTAVNFLRGETASDGRSFFNLQIDLLKSLGVSLTKDEAGDLARRWIRSVDSGRFYHQMRAVPFFVSTPVKGEEGDEVGGYVLRPLFDLFNPIRDAIRSVNLRRTLDYVAGILRREDFPSLLTYGEYLWDKDPEPVPTPEAHQPNVNEIMHWVRNLECPTATSQESIEEILLRRSAEIVDDFHNGITTWELVDNQARRSWKSVEFKAKTEKVLQKLGRPEQSNPDKSALQGLLNVMRYFTLKPGEKRTQQRQFTPQDVTKFLHEASTDARLMLYFYPGEKTPRVRLVNTLDRLDLVLISADFKPVIKLPFGGHIVLKQNFGQKFLAIVAEAWGDEPYEIWPEYIKKKYPQGGKKAKRPDTLYEAYLKIADTLNRTRKMLGNPELPKCQQVGPPIQLPGEPVVNAPDWDTLDSIKADLFNGAQVLSVIHENIPTKEFPNRQGMRILRNLFFELYTSNPWDLILDKDGKPEDLNGCYGFLCMDGAPSTRAGFRNNLTVITQLVRMGLTRQVSRQLRSIQYGDPELQDFMESLIEGAASPKTLKMMELLLKKDPEHKLIWGVLDQVFAVFDAAEGNPTTPKRIKEWKKASTSKRRELLEEWNADADRMKQLAFYGVASLKQLGITEATLTTVVPVLEQYGDYLREHSEQLESVFRAKKPSLLIRALYEDRSEEYRRDKREVANLIRDTLNEPNHALDILAMVKAMDLDPVSHGAIDLFDQRREKIEEDPEYQKLNTGDLARDLVDFFQETSTDPQKQTALKVRMYLADRLHSRDGNAGDVEELISLVQSKPDGFYQVLEAVSENIQNRELERFVELARRSISEPAH